MTKQAEMLNLFLTKRLIRWKIPGTKSHGGVNENGDQQVLLYFEGNLKITIKIKDNDTMIIDTNYTERN